MNSESKNKWKARITGNKRNITKQQIDLVDEALYCISFEFYLLLKKRHWVL